MTDPDSCNVGRFVAAQNGTFVTVLAELGVGAKRSHWMWFVFPQLARLGSKCRGAMRSAR